MALKLTYAVRETGSNLRRNLTLTLAAFVTVTVSLALSGSALLLRKGVDNATARWRGGVEFIVFMKVDAPQDQIDAVGRQLDQLTSTGQIKAAKYIDKAAALEEVKKLFPNQPDIVDAFGAAGPPTSWRVVPGSGDADVISSLGRQFKGQAGVLDVVFAKDAIQRFQRFTDFLKWIFYVAAGSLLLAAVLLIVNTIRLAMFARRREIEVMKLVGATNWFIRIPFMLEGLVQGVIGAVVAWASVWGLNRWLRSRVSSDPLNYDVFQSLSLSGGEVRSIGMMLFVVGVAVSVIGSGIAVTRFLDV